MIFPQRLLANYSFQGSQAAFEPLRETLLDLNTCRDSMEPSVRAKALGLPARSVQGPSSSLVKGLAPPRGYQSPIMDGDPGALATSRNRGQRSWVQIPPAPPDENARARILSLLSATLISDESEQPGPMQSVTKVRPVPQGYHTVTPYLIVEGAPKVMEFLKRVFSAEQKDFMSGPEGRVAHAEMKIGDSVIMMADATSENRAMPSQLYVYVDDVDTVYKKALEAGGTSISEPTNQFYGDRNANVKDPVGNIWGIATHVEDVPPEEMQRRIKERANQ